MIILNFSHPLTDANLQQIEALSHEKVDQVINVPTQFDSGLDFQSQARDLLSHSQLDSVILQTVPVILNLPSFSAIAALILAELHGRMGYFPSVLRLRVVEGITPPRFEVAEIINLQSIRDDARMKR